MVIHSKYCIVNFLNLIVYFTNKNNLQLLLGLIKREVICKRDILRPHWRCKIFWIRRKIKS